MVKVNAPALSLDASGSIAGALVFSKWKGRNYVRSLVKPANPQSGGQVGVRAAFKFLSQQWAANPAASQATFEPPADQDIVSPFNAYMKYNLLRNRNFLGMSQVFDTPLTDVVDVVNVFTATAGVRQITISISETLVNGDNWGFLIYRSTTTGFTPAFDNLVSVLLQNGGVAVDFVDTPLTPDTYYYDAKPFCNDGVLGALKGEINATVV